MQRSTNSTSHSCQGAERQYPMFCSIQPEARRLNCSAHCSCSGAVFESDSERAAQGAARPKFGAQIETPIPTREDVRMFDRIAKLSVMLLTAVVMHVSSAAPAEPLRYELGFEPPSTHLMDVTIRASGLAGPTADFAMPDWAPGSYYIQNYAVNVQGFRASSANGKELSWRKTDSQTWRVDLSGANAATIQYQVFGDTLRNNQADYDERHVFIGGPSVWMYLIGGKERPIELSIAVPAGWKVATG